MSNPLSKKSRKDVIVSIRLPKGLVDELKDIQQVNHFMDISDEIRFIVRKYCLSFMNSQNSHATDSLLEQKRKDKLIQDLTKILNNLKNDQSSGKDAAKSVEQNSNQEVEQNAAKDTSTQNDGYDKDG